MSQSALLLRQTKPFWVHWIVGIAIATALAAGLTAVTAHLLADPKVILLLPSGGAQWIKPDQPFDSSARFDPRYLKRSFMFRRDSPVPV